MKVEQENFFFAIRRAFQRRSFSLGKSRAIAAFSLDLAAEKVADVIREHAHGGKASMVGLSEGAQVTVQLLAIAPELVEKAIISSAVHPHVNFY